MLRLKIFMEHGTFFFTDKKLPKNMCFYGVLIIFVDFLFIHFYSIF